MQSSRPNLRPLKRANVTLELRSFLERLEGADKRPLLIFICGGNTDTKPAALSYRRKCLLDYLKTHDHYYPVLAEDVFKHYADCNLMKVEEIISASVDKIVIILESYSAFVELGAFSIDLLRKKLIIINDSTFKDAESFVNYGPLDQIKRENSDNLILYKFLTNSKEESCPISQAFPTLNATLAKASESLSTSTYSVRNWESDPRKISPSTIMLLHDVIFFLGPIDHIDMIDAYKAIYQIDTSYDNIKPMRGMLLAMKLIEQVQIGSIIRYKSTQTKTFFRFHRSINKLIARAKISQIKLSK